MESENLKIFKLRKYIAANSTYKELAALVGTSEKYLNHIALGKKKASPDMARRISAATNGEVSPADIRPDLAEIFQHG